MLRPQRAAAPHAARAMRRARDAPVRPRASIRPACAQRMVERLRPRRHRSSRACSPRSPRCRATCSSTPRWSTQAYEDTSLPIGHGQTISKPSVVARMIELLFGGANARAPRRASARVLEIGTGCGYQAALLAQLSQQVVSVERLRAAARQGARAAGAAARRPTCAWCIGDGMLGHAPNAPYDSIIAAAGGDDAPAGLARAARRRRPPGRAGAARPAARGRCWWSSTGTERRLRPATLHEAVQLRPPKIRRSTDEGERSMHA